MKKPTPWPFPNVHIFWYSWGDQKPGVWDAEQGVILNDIDTAAHDDEVVVYAKKCCVKEHTLEDAARWLRKKGYPKARVAHQLFSN